MSKECSCGKDKCKICGEQVKNKRVTDRTDMDCIGCGKEFITNIFEDSTIEVVCPSCKKNKDTDMEEGNMVEFGEQYNTYTKFFTVCYDSTELIVDVPIKLETIRFDKQEATAMRDVLNKFIEGN